MTQNESEFYILNYKPVCCLYLFSIDMTHRVAVLHMSAQQNLQFIHI